jgi:hypothetical protein
MNESGFRAGNNTTDYRGIVMVGRYNRSSLRDKLLEV